MIMTDLRVLIVATNPLARGGLAVLVEGMPGVKIVGTFPAESHPPIIYPVAATATAKPEARQYLDYLRSQTAKAVLERYGFNYLLKPTS